MSSSRVWTYHVVIAIGTAQWASQALFIISSNIISWITFSAKSWTSASFTIGHTRCTFKVIIHKPSRKTFDAQVIVQAIHTILAIGWASETGHSGGVQSIISLTSSANTCWSTSWASSWASNTISTHKSISRITCWANKCSIATRRAIWSRARRAGSSGGNIIASLAISALACSWTIGAKRRTSNACGNSSLASIIASIAMKTTSC